MTVDQIDNIFINLADQNHLDNIHSILISNPHPLNKRAFDSHSFQNLTDLGATAVNNYRINTNKFKQSDILGERLLQFLVNHGMPAIFNDECFTVKFLDKGQGFT